MQFKSMDHMKTVTNWEPLNEDELVMYQQQAEAKFPEAHRSFDFILSSEFPPIVGSRNTTKFTPHIAFLRTATLTTMSELGSIFTYVSDLTDENQYGLVLDDRTYEDASVIS
jgi:hypothetical protein